MHVRVRQLKFVESVLFEGRQDVYGSEIHETKRATPADLEMPITTSDLL